MLLVPLYVWSRDLNYAFSSVTLHQFFPLLGMLAFSLMWLQIVALSLPHWREGGFDTDRFLRQSGVVVLLLIVAHPLLLDIAQYRAGAGKPPASLYAYVPESMHIYITLAITALTIFLVLEISSYFQKWGWVRRLQPAIEYAGYIGFFLIFVHSLSLGGNLQAGWLRYLWWFYGASALVLLSWRAIRTMSTTEHA